MTTEINEYKSRLNDKNSKKFETFSYLPPMDDSDIRKQIAYMIEKGWNPAVEHVEPPRANCDYWYMWKLPMFGEKNIDKIMDELTECKNAHPGDHVRIIGYDNFRQTQGQSMVVFRGD